jgi:hypothetical protein
MNSLIANSVLPRILRDRVMKRILFLLSGLLSAISVFAQASVPAGITARGFATNGAFQLQINGGQPLEIEYSTNLTTWTPLEKAAQHFADTAAVHSEWRFYRAKTAGGGFAPDVVGFIKVPIEPGKMVLVGSPFEGNIHLDKPAVRKAVFGTETPSVQFYLMENGKQTTYNWDEFANNWSPTPPPIPAGTGFMVRNTGKDRIFVRFGGELKQGALKRPIAQGDSYIVPLVPKPGPLQQAVAVPGLDGAQLHVWNEQKQAYDTSSFNKEKGHWEPALQYKPGRAVEAKLPHAAAQAATFNATK